MKQTIEQPKISPAEKMAATIRQKRIQNIPLTEKEEVFLREQREENKRDDNPQHGH